MPKRVSEVSAWTSPRAYIIRMSARQTRELSNYQCARAQAAYYTYLRSLGRSGPPPKAIEEEE